MGSGNVAVVTPHRQNRRQVARSLHSGGILTTFYDRPDVDAILAQRPGITIIDCDAYEPPDTLAVVRALDGISSVVLLSSSADKSQLLDLIHKHDIGNLVAKHGAIRAVYPMLDERELLVTCEKVLRRNIFGIEKYVGSWGVVVHHAVLTKLAEKSAVLEGFERYLNALDVPETITQGIVTVAEELILNAVIHAPRDEHGHAKYESIGPRHDLCLDKGEEVRIAYGCDGQRLMLSVTDNFGRLEKHTLRNYLTRAFDGAMLTTEDKASGAGLGLSMSLRSIHQLIFNIQDQKRTEVIAGWYLRVNSAGEFRQVGKSLNVFWLPKDSVPRHDTPHTGVDTVYSLAP
ncbi:MAG: hypothetical protein ABI321_12280 [Polyangia bacterium]